LPSPYNTSAEFQLSRQVRIPDPLRLARFHRSPDLGPKILFFSGGSALRGLSGQLSEYTYNSIHLITPFDSGGSSAVLRNAFRMLSVGDLRNRLMALADKTVTGHPAIVELFNTRFPKNVPSADLRTELSLMIEGNNPLIRAIPNPMQKIIRNHLGYFFVEMPEEFDLRGASIGNLVLVGGYLNNGRHIDPVVFIFSKLAEVRGTVRSVVNADLHLAFTLKDGSRIIGQHRITGKEAPPIASPVETIELSKSGDIYDPTTVEIRPKISSFIGEAELICYPIGSFFSSLIANLLPHGVGTAIIANRSPKVYIPNPAGDPEQIGLSIDQEVCWIHDCIRKDVGELAINQAVNVILLDHDDNLYGRPLNLEKLREFGIIIARTKLRSPSDPRYFDSELLAQAIASI
jgi:CofD-related protein of GAK system